MEVPTPWPSRLLPAEPFHIFSFTFFTVLRSRNHLLIRSASGNSARWEEFSQEAGAASEFE